jgi:hypothetical protein
MGEPLRDAGGDTWLDKVPDESAPPCHAWSRNYNRPDFALRRPVLFLFPMNCRCYAAQPALTLTTLGLNADFE